MRQLELYINSNIDRLVNENASTSLQFTTLLSGSKRLMILPNENKVKFKLSAIELPNIIYNFSSIENRFYVIVYDASGSGAVPQSIEYVELDPNRIYALPSDIISYLNNEFATHSNSILQDVSLNYSDLTKKVTLNNGSVRTIRPISSYRFPQEDAGGLGIASVVNDMMDRLGFSTLYTDTKIEPAQSLTGNGTIRMLKNNCYYLALKELSAPYEQSIIPDPSILSKRILGRITASNFGSLSQLQFASETEMEVSAGYIIDRLEFELLDQEYRPIDLVNHPITFSIQITIS